MNRSGLATKRWVMCMALAATVAGCAAKPESPKSPEAAPSPPSPSTPAAGGYPGQPGYPQQAQPAPPPPTGTTPGAQAGKPDTAETRATRDFDTAERELSVAAGDCSNACRALGSMDRAAGNICKLTSDPPRCEDAAAKVRTARDKVKNSCGDCKETSTNRNDPVPSR